MGENFLSNVKTSLDKNTVNSTNLKSDVWVLQFENPISMTALFTTNNAIMPTGFFVLKNSLLLVT